MGYLILFAVILTIILLLLGMVWNLIVAMLYFWLLWVPPVSMAGIFLCHPQIATWFVCCLYHEANGREWAANAQSIAQTWRKSLYGVSVFLLCYLLVFAWSLLAPWASLWPREMKLPLFFEKDFGWSVGLIRQWFFQRSAMSVFILGLSSTVAAIGIHRILQQLLVWRIARIERILNGSDEFTAQLAEKDERIQDAYCKLGVNQASHHADTYRGWTTRTVKDIIRNSSIAKSAFDGQHAQAVQELDGLTRCIECYTVACETYRRGLVRLRKLPSRALLGSLEDAGDILVSPTFKQLVASQRWDDVLSLLDELVQELQHIESLSDDCVGEDANGRSDVGTGPVTRRQALELLGLSESSKNEDVSARRRQFAKIYHPDGLQDCDQRKRNEDTLKKINQACDLLLREYE